ncbi:MAG: class I SAM-dependent methyltransferase [Methyloceanibacter sp.]|nr:class I SAM-dependent methyltransferase [Methyloceanibacter sp.]
MTYEFPHISPDAPAPDRLELGCGRHKNEGYFGVDRADLEGVDLVHDLDVYPWPIQHGCAEEVICHQTLEHIRDIIGFMRELWRVCAADAYIEIVVPYYQGPAADGDPTHVRRFSETSFRYYEPDFVEAFSDYGLAPCYFHIIDLAWKPTGNLWVLLRPIKTPEDLETFREEQVWRRRKTEMLG